MIGIWLARFVSPPTPILLYVITLLAGLLGCLIVIPFTSFVYNSAQRTNVIEFIVYREFVVTLARVVIYSIALFVITDISNLFLAGALASAFILLF
jgi:hypothetical protein